MKIKEIISYSSKSFTQDKGQVEFYMNLVDNYVKESSNNSTIGTIITKDQDKFVANFVRSEKLAPLTYKFV